MQTSDEKFLYASNITLGHEKGYADVAADPGKATKFGISLRFLKALVAQDAGHDFDLDGDGDLDADDIKLLSVAEAFALYKTEFWDRYGYGRLDTLIAARIFDICVNTGPHQAHLILQRAIRGHQIDIKIDGKIGEQTLGAANTLSVNEHGERSLLASIRVAQAAFYRELVTQKPTLKVFLKGWLRRAYS